MVSDKSLVRNTLYNFLGRGLPTIAAFVFMPLLIDGLGTDKFGVLNIAWLIVGYFSLLDLGTGQALTHIVSQKLGLERENDVPAIFWIAFCLMFLMGVLGMFVFGALSPLMVYDWLNIPAPIQPETLSSFYLLAISLPFVITTIGFRSILEAKQHFGAVNAVSIPMGLFTYLGPMLALLFSSSISAITTVLVMGRIIQWLTYLLVCFHVIPDLRNRVSLDWSFVLPLFHFGKWMTVSSIVGPVMVYIDGFLIGAFTSMSELTFYATPQRMVSKLTILAGAMASVLFPAFSSAFVQERDRSKLLFEQGTKYILLVLFPLVLTIVTFSYEGLDLWLGAEFATESTRVLQWLSAGVLLNSLASIPFALVRGVGRPSIPAKLHVIELPFYVFALWLLLRFYGIEGAAIAWTARMLVDAVILFHVAHSLLRVDTVATWRVFLSIGVCLLLLVIAGALPSFAVRVVFVPAVLTIFVIYAWRFMLTSGERALAKRYVKSLHAFILRTMNTPYGG